MSLRNQIKDLLNKASRENESNTPDWLLADYLMLCLDAGEKLVVGREKWYGKFMEPNRLELEDESIIANFPKIRKRDQNES